MIVSPGWSASTINMSPRNSVNRFSGFCSLSMYLHSTSVELFAREVSRTELVFVFFDFEKVDMKQQFISADDTNFTKRRYSFELNALLC